MGTLKQESIGTKTKKKKPTVADKMRAKLQFAELIGESLMRALPSISEYLVEEEAPVVCLRIASKNGGPYMASLEIDQDPRNGIAFGTGDTPIEALMGLEVRILERGFTEAYSYEERQAMKDKKR